MTFKHNFYDEGTGLLLFTMPFMDRTLRIDDLFRRDGVNYKIESVLMIMDTTTQNQGLESEYSIPIVEVKVSIVP